MPIVVKRLAKGDTLAAIANRHGVSIAALKRVNGMTGSTIRTGQRLRLPA
jgi:LysM repeat protein